MVVISDFIGKYRVAMDPDSKVMLSQYISIYEPQYLKMLLGCALYDLYLAGPLEPRFIAITEPFCMDVSGGCGKNSRRQYISEGIDEMSKGFIYFHYVPDSGHKQTTSGSVVNKNENSEASDLLEVAVTDRWNRAIITYQAIQYLIEQDEATYPEFNGVPLKLMFFGGAF